MYYIDIKRFVFLLTAIMLSGVIKAQISDAPFVDGAQGVQTDQVSVPDHRGDDAFLRRYSNGDREHDQLMISATSRIQRKLEFKLEALGNAGSGDFAPFWHTSGRQGLSPTNNSGFMLDLGLDGGMRLPSQFYFNYGIDIAVAANYQSDFYLQQTYIDAGYKWFDLSIGAKEHWGELANNRLSSGSLTWSGNSRPIPQIRLEVPEFTRLGILGRLVSLKGHIAYGWYMDSSWRADRAAIYSKPPKYTERILHHGKSFFLRIGDAERFPLEFTAGLEMYAQFGGTRHNMQSTSADPLVESYEFPHDFKAYMKVFLPVNKAGGQTGDNGNTLGSWHFAFDLTMSKWKYRMYYEHFYEDHSSMLGIEYKSDANGQKEFISYGLRRNWFDGLFGFELNVPDGLPFKDIVFEVLNTRGQCGPVYRYPNEAILQAVDGRDNMYCHEFYKSYSYYGYANGTPILVSPLYNKDGNLSFKSNRVLMFHLGIDGTISHGFSYRILASHTSHWGTYDYPLNEREEITSVLMECMYQSGKIKDWQIGLSVAADFDSGNLTGDNRGVMIKIAKLWKVL